MASKHVNEEAHWFVLIIVIDLFSTILQLSPFARAVIDFLKLYRNKIYPNFYRQKCFINLFYLYLCSTSHSYPM